MLPLWFFVINELEEDGETKDPESCQTGVVDDVEDGDEEPAHGGSAHDCPSLLVVEEPFDGLQSMSLDRLDGGATNGDWFSWHAEG